MSLFVAITPSNIHNPIRNSTKHDHAKHFLMFLFFLTLILFNFLGRVLWNGWMVHGWYVVCGVLFCKILDWEPTFLVFLLILNLVGFSLVGLFIDMTVQARFLVCGGFIFCGSLDFKTTFFLLGNGPKKYVCIFFNISSILSPWVHCSWPQLFQDCLQYLFLGLFIWGT